MMPLLRSHLAGHSAAELSAVFEKNGLPFAPITRPEDLFDDPHLQATGGLAPMTLAGRARDAGAAAAPDAWRRAARACACSRPGSESTGAELLAELGYDQAEIEALRSAKVIATPS